MTGRHGFGGGPHGFGGGPSGFGGPRGPRGRRARRGDIRWATLLLLAEEPRNGYGLMQEIEDRSGGVWRPSPGSVYPSLAQLEDEGLIRTAEHDGRKVFELTDEGRAQVAKRSEGAHSPWETMTHGVPEDVHELRRAYHALGAAARQVAEAGDPEQLAEATRIVDAAQRSLYRVLAGDEPAGEA